MLKKIFLTSIILLFTVIVFAQNPYILQNVQLPFTTEAKDFFVKKIGTNYILNGDIIVGSTLQRTTIYQNNNTNGGYLWPKGYVAVSIDLSIYKNNLQNFAFNGLEELQNNTNVRFVPYTNQKDYIRIMYSPDISYGGLSQIGKGGGEQILYITRMANTTTVMHEMLHALGFWHEQSRYDRDQFVRINSDNIDGDFKYNFQIEPGTTASPYDYQSIMHYSSNAFAKDPTKPTLQCKTGNTVFDCIMGNSNLSSLDIVGVNASYWYNAGLTLLNYQTELRKTETLNDLANQQTKNSALLKSIKQQPITNGIYKIKINQTGKCLAIEGISKDNGARLVQWDYVDQANHQFMVKKLADGFYEINALHSGKYLNAAGQSKANGTPIIQWDWVNQDNLKWNIYYNTQTGNQGWVIENKNASPIRLNGGVNNKNNGDGFVLMRTERTDANEYEVAQTFTFEKIGEAPLTEKSLYQNAPGMIKKMKVD